MNSLSHSSTEQENELNYQKIINFACGYLELGMDSECWAELDKLCIQHQLRSPVIKFRWYLLMRRNLYPAAARVARAGTVLHPADTSFFLLTAYAYEKHEDYVSALDVWEAAPLPIRETAYAHYQSARYAAKLGLKEQAQEHLQKAIQREPQYSFAVEYDSLLGPLVHADKSDNSIDRIKKSLKR